MHRAALQYYVDVVCDCDARENDVGRYGWYGWLRSGTGSRETQAAASARLGPADVTHAAPLASTIPSRRRRDRPNDAVPSIYLITLHFHEFPCRAKVGRSAVHSAATALADRKKGQRSRVKFTPVTRKSGAPSLRH